ncbi:signal peptide peptidase SppA [Sporosarcina pasteurii]|uniref:Protease 4 n=1 Tax=Sporosarcina pasteurii TaxID=1474 RepID=A0A380C770_SPOPA|nr:signal peptide peptidase SppA [Sporosarcina pasteurii]MDS9471754.1 signal peptide peptidase SppA [Sporosarcina pasteurii]QBQ04649.1 signal peptide peptidase SppA [Sporosarcina pasteurii]SUJ13149.1 Protease 4 [Sporosarcina pasteurii]
MTAKRWIAIIAASILLIVSIGVNTLSYFFTRDFSGFLDEMAATDGYSENIIEAGRGKDKIAVLTLDGVIQDLGNVSPFLPVGYNHGFFMNQLHEIYEDPFVKGVVLSVNSPGGGVVESADIYDAIRMIQEDKEIPVYVSMGGMAASGGYYVSAPAEKIFVNHETITGSIGVIMESINFAKLAEKYGVDFNTIKTGPYKDIMSSSREMTAEEREMLQEMINDSYERFVDIIVEGRGMSDAAVRKVADGRIMNGRQAIEAGLADDYGKVGDVISAIQEDHELQNATVFEYTMNESLSSLFGMKLTSMFANQRIENELLGKLLSDYSAPRMMYLYGNH